jgi:hypothetical protein
MPRATALLALAACFALGSGADAKGRPGPITCPADVGAAVATTCPCNGRMLPNGSVQPWRNHGQYVSCIVRYRNALRKAGCFTDDSVRRTFARCAARSTCGKTDAVLCCISETGTCNNDPKPGDGMAAGTCSNDPAVACDVATDCTTTHARIARDATSCAAAGGTDGGSGSVCVACTTTTTSSTTTTTLP